jgi:hypothetical protein
MNYFKLTVALLGSTSLVFAAANPRADENGVCHFDYLDELNLESIVKQGDDPAPLETMIQGCRTLSYRKKTEFRLHEMILWHRQAQFRLIFPIVNFEGAESTRNRILCELLRTAFHHHNIEVAEYLMGQPGLTLEPGFFDSRVLWATTYGNNLDEVRQLFQRHPAYIAAFAPDRSDIVRAQNLEEARRLVAFTRVYDDLTDQHTFEAARWLEELATSGFFLLERDVAEIANYLIQEEGAPFDQHIRGLLAGRPRVLDWLEDWNQDVKDPGCN